MEPFIKTARDVASGCVILLICIVPLSVVAGVAIGFAWRVASTIINFTL
jgi:hypothetical protein